MTNFIIRIYRFFQKKRVLFYSLLIACSIIFVYFGSKVEYEEDISKLLPPSDESDGSEKVVFANLKVKDKLFVVFAPGKESISSKELAAVCGDFVDSLLAEDASHKKQVIDAALYRIDDDLIRDGIEFIYRHLPLFLDSDDYRKMDSLLTKENIERQMAENYAALLSPAGMAFRETVARDPVAFRTIFTDKLNVFSEGAGANYILYDQHFFTPDTLLALAFISPNFLSFNSKESIKLIEMLEGKIAQFQTTHPDVKISYHGAPAQSVYNSRQIKKDLVTTLVISLLIISVIILYCFRNKLSLFYLLAPVVFGTFFSLTMVYFIKGSMSLQAMGIGAVVLGVALSYSLHVLTHFKYVTDPEIVIKDQTTPLILSCLTTVGAFTALLFTQSELLKDFGIFASLALIGTTIFSLICLPQFFNPEKNKRSDTAFWYLEKINSYPLERRTRLIIGIVALSLVCLVTGRWVTFDADLKNIGYHEKQVVDSRELLNEHTIPGYTTMYYATTSHNLDSALILNRQMSDLMDTLGREKKIRSFSKAASLFLPESAQQDKIERWNRYWTPERKEQTGLELIKAGETYHFKAEMFQPFFAALDTDYRPVSLYDSGIIPPAMLNNLIEYTDSTYIVFTPVQLEAKNLAEVNNRVAANKKFIVIDPFFYTKDMVLLLNRDFDITLGISSIFVFIVLLLSYRNLVLAVLGFLPMALSWYIVLGIMGIFGIQFNLINIIISTFIFGIGVDYSIYVMDGLLAGYRSKYQLLTYHKTAIFFSAIVLIIGIASLLFATHPAISSIGLSTLIGMSTAVLIAYSLQPFLFYRLIKRPVARGKAPFSLHNFFHITLSGFFQKREGWGKRGFTEKERMINNFAYKGTKVVSTLRKEINATQNYEALEPYIKNGERFLEYGCGCGYLAYWIGFKRKENRITAYDSDKNALAVAEHCYLKNEWITFTSDIQNVLEKSYDVVILNKVTADDEPDIRQVIADAHTVVIRKKDFAEIWEIPIANGFTEIMESDKLFVFFEKKGNLINKAKWK